MADTEQIRQQVQSPAPLSTWLGVVLLMVVFWVIAVAIIGPAPRGDTYEQQRAQNREKKLKDLRDEDAKALTSYSWIDKNKGKTAFVVLEHSRLSRLRSLMGARSVQPLTDERDNNKFLLVRVAL